MTFSPTMPLSSPNNNSEKAQKIYQLANERLHEAGTQAAISYKKDDLKTEKANYEKVNDIHYKAQDASDYETEREAINFLEPGLEKLNAFKTTIETLENKLHSHQ